MTDSSPTGDPEANLARDDLKTQYSIAVSRLDDIITNGSTYTATQTRDAVIDEARILRRLLRFIRDVS